MQFAFCQESTWTLVQAGEDIYNGQLESQDWPNRWDLESLDMKPVVGGFLTCGHYNDEIFDSTDGNVYDLTNKNGAYLAKYNFDGELQWLVRTEKAADEERNVIMSIATDSQNNIYIIGHSDGTLYDTNGNSQAVSPQWPSGNSSSFLMKFDENGGFLWKTLIYSVEPKRVAIDKEDNIVVCGSFWGQNGAELFHNDQYAGEYTNITNNDVNYYIAKYAPNGMPLWDAGVYIDSVNAEFLEGITFDGDNNIYLNGIFEMNLKVYDADEQDYIEKVWSNQYGGSMFIAKYTPDGDGQWIVNSDQTLLSKIITNDDGSHFVTGSNTVNYSSESQIMTNADGTIITQSAYGPYYFAKISTEGNWEWVTGSTGTYSGGGQDMVKYNDKISIIGALLSNAFNTPATGALYGTTGFSPITINADDSFIATYNLDGSLVSISKSGNNVHNLVGRRTSGFIRGEDDAFYVQRNLGFLIDGGPHTFYGQTIGPISGTDATITKFYEADGEMVMSAKESNGIGVVTLAPNPTEKDFIITFNNTYAHVNLIITDISGKAILQKDYNNVSQVPAEIIGSAGVYFVKVIADDNLQWFKIIKR
ncbi:hypothetical protein Q766_07825 [Flavobacterium subsaxonicum WB 4.1-42 = DSM 21790]|uniref:Secretion system C-terminal sorting domain-containing protein n=2 Tax=Flavobacterium TaxID=237 RepID=A0A0A2MKR3_9FLAO|nr:hypothetical protein Q766_07825 [Flavobacterium subsaxonicum WB 4.1-42 = DSM 21790]